MKKLAQLYVIYKLYLYIFFVLKKEDILQSVKAAPLLTSGTDF